MKKAILISMAMMLTACANMRQATPDQCFEAFRAEIRTDREAGQITVVDEQEKLHDRYWQIYGKDADGAGHFAYSISLVRSAQAGDFPMKEAQALVSAREKENFARKVAARQVASGDEFPPN